MDPILFSEPVPPNHANVRNPTIFQSVQVTTIWFLLLVLENISCQHDMVNVTATFSIFPLYLEGCLFAALIMLAITVKCAVVASTAMAHKLPHKLGRMYDQIIRACQNYFTVARGLTFAGFFGLFTTNSYETVFPTFMLGASSFLLLTAFYFMRHFQRTLDLNEHAWCRNMTWTQMFPTAHGSKAYAIDLDTVGNDIYNWFGFLSPYALRPNLCFAPIRPFADEEDFAYTMSGWAAAALVNTLHCSVLHKGKLLNPGSEYILIHEDTRTMVDTYYISTPNRLDLTVAAKDTMINFRVNCHADPMTCIVSNAPHAADFAVGGRYNQIVTVGAVMLVLCDIRSRVLGRAGSVYYDSSGVDARSGPGADIPRCEALMLIMLYGGYVPFSTTFINAFHLFDNLYYSDGQYFQDDNNGNYVDITNGYLKSFHDLVTFTLEIVRGSFSSLTNRYLDHFKTLGIKIHKVIFAKVTGSTAQLLTYLAHTANSVGTPFQSPFEAGTNIPSLAGSQTQAALIVRNDPGLILAPSISLERTVASSVMNPEGKVTLANYLTRNPWDTISSIWNEPMPGFL